MVKRKQDKLKKKLAQAHNDLERALGNLKEVEQQFVGVHDDYAEVLQIMAADLIQVQLWILGFWAKAWGKPPKDIEKWRG